MTKTDDHSTAATKALIDRLRRSVRGRLILPQEPAFEGARRVWNGMIDRHPAAILRCAGAGDVAEAIRASADAGILVAVRGGGHNVAGNAVCDDGLVVDLSEMRVVEVDRQRRRVHAQGGATWGDFDRATQAVGLAATGGEVSTTGIAGLTLGGGMGWLMGKLGLACDSLVEAEVVCADGEVRIANESEHADLFWALRGGGGNFGVVTRFVYALSPIDRVLAGMVLYPMDRAGEFLERYRDCTASAPDELTVMLLLLTTAELEPAVGAIVCHCGEMEQGERLIRPLRAVRGAIADTIGPMPYVDLQSMLDATAPPGRNNYWKASFVPDIGSHLIEALVEHSKHIPSPFSSILIEHLHGAVSRVAPDATAFGLRAQQYSIGIFAVWEDPAETEMHRKWARDTFVAVQPFSSGSAYVNYLGDDAGSQLRASFGGNYERLVDVKTRYDPRNLFRVNFNIPPRIGG